MTKPVSFSLAFVTMNKHRESNSRTSVLRGRGTADADAAWAACARGAGGTLASLASERPSYTASWTISEVFSYRCEEPVWYARRIVINWQIMALLGFFFMLINFFMLPTTRSACVCLRGWFCVANLVASSGLWIHIFWSAFGGKWYKLHKSTAYS